MPASIARPRLALGSCHIAKRMAVERIAPSFWPAWDLVCLEVASGVRPQPLSDEETVAGALTRARAARVQVDADIGIGLESGLTRGPLGRWYVVSWAVVLDRAERIGIGGAERFPLPTTIAERVLRGHELSHALADVLGTTVTATGGAVSIVSGGRRDRIELLAVALLHALCDLACQAQHGT
ncbi:MAG: inosine/xanthosine triphosphatase [Thermomicrobium sp.]|nr:inosine/xanthosine triphosphatase [Thermomicrobium sp.]